MSSKLVVACEVLEGRLLLSGNPVPAINDLDLDGKERAHTTIDCYVGVPLHVTALGLAGYSGSTPVQLTGTDLNVTGDTYGTAEVRARWVWTFSDSTGAYNVLEGFNAAHIFETAGTYSVNLAVTNHDGYTGSTSVTVNVAANPYTDPMVGTKIYVADVSDLVGDASEEAPISVNDLRHRLARDVGYPSVPN
jgi:hypothetical protein